MTASRGLVRRNSFRDFEKSLFRVAGRWIASGMEARRAETPVVAEAAPLATARRRRRTAPNRAVEGCNDGHVVAARR